MFDRVSRKVVVVVDDNTEDLRIFKENENYVDVNFVYDLKIFKVKIRIEVVA